MVLQPQQIYVHYDYDNPPSLSSSTINKGHVDSHGFYTVPKISIVSPTYNNFSFKTTVAGVTDFGLNDEAYESRNFIFDSTDKESFVILQEIFVNYKDASHNLTIGRQELGTPLIEPDDYYMLADSYEAISYINTALDNYTINLGYIARMAGVWDSGDNGTEFHSMSDTSFVDARDKANADDSGVIYAAVEYKNETHKIKAWEYYISNLYNIFLAQYDFANKTDSFSYEAAAQFINYKEIGSTLAAWGGFPTFTYGFIYNWFDTGSLRNAALYKAQLGYDLSKIGLQNSWIGYRYIYYDLDSTYSKTASSKPQDSMQLNGVRFKYAPDGGIYFIANYEHRDLSNEPDASAFKLIGGYKF